MHYLMKLQSLLRVLLVVWVLNPLAAMAATRIACGEGGSLQDRVEDCGRKNGNVAKACVYVLASGSLAFVEKKIDCADREKFADLTMAFEFYPGEPSREPKPAVHDWHLVEVGSGGQEKWLDVSGKRVWSGFQGLMSQPMGLKHCESWPVIEGTERGVFSLPSVSDLLVGSVDGI